MCISTEGEGGEIRLLDGSGLTLSCAVYISLVPREIYNRVSIQDSVARI